jgi:DNA-binding NarL/FixJ family response regulator
MPVRVFLLDDHEIVRRGIGDLLEASGDFIVVGEAGTAEQAINRLHGLEVDVAVLDIRLPDGNGIEVCREIRSQFPDIRCLMLTSFSDDEALVDAAMAGASGYALKQLRGTDIVDAVRSIAAGQTLLDDTLVKRAFSRLEQQAGEQNALNELTDQERRIFELIGQGRSNRQIAETLYLAEKTVKNYVSNLLAKLGMERRTEAAVFATRLEMTGHPIEHDD